MTLFLTRQVTQANCPIKFWQGSRDVSIQYLLQGTWAISLAREIVIKILCDNGYETSLVLKPSVHVIKLNRGCKGTSASFFLDKYLVGESNFQLAKVPAMMQNQSVWDLLAQPVNRAMIKIPNLLTEVATRSSSANGLIREIQSEIHKLSEIPKSDFKSGRLSVASILAICALCLLVVVVIGVVLYLYIYKRSMIMGLMRRLQELRNQQNSAQVNMAYNNASGSVLKIVE